ncbi:MAG: hypothetical protein MPJ52_01420 [Alphaproteobacteria bacterium]|nr:hypothetical protein [Alphaproteobacteria bacterium]
MINFKGLLTSVSGWLSSAGVTLKGAEKAQIGENVNLWGHETNYFFTHNSGSNKKKVMRTLLGVDYLSYEWVQHTIKSGEVDKVLAGLKKAVLDDDSSDFGLEGIYLFCLSAFGKKKDLEFEADRFARGGNPIAFNYLAQFKKSPKDKLILHLTGAINGDATAQHNFYINYRLYHERVLGSEDSKFMIFCFFWMLQLVCHNKEASPSFKHLALMDMERAFNKDVSNFQYYTEALKAVEKYQETNNFFACFSEEQIKELFTV